MKDSEIYGIDHLGSIRRIRVNTRGNLRQSYFVRDIILTAMVTLATGTETTLLAGVAGEYHDLLYISMANNSTAVTDITIRESTGATANFVIRIPASNTALLDFKDAPWSQTVAGNTWTLDMADITGTSVYVSAIFAKNTV